MSMFLVECLSFFSPFQLTWTLCSWQADPGIGNFGGAGFGEEFGGAGFGGAFNGGWADVISFSGFLERKQSRME